jgi:hypothetical protein
MAELRPIQESQKYFSQLSLSPYKRDSAFDLENTTPTLVVRLPLPTEMRDDTTVGYTSINLETVGDIFKNNSDMLGGAMARNAGNLLQAGLSGTASGISRMAGTAGGNIVGKLAAAAVSGGIGLIQGLLPAEQVSSAIQQQYGVAPNPNPSVQFQGPVLRDFTLSWAFYPKNQVESATIFSLITKLKARALPSYNTVGASAGAVLNYPHVCQVNFWPWDSGGSGPNGWDSRKSIIRMKKCFMSGVNVNYHPYGTPSFFEGAESQPVSIQLTISFKEIEYLTSYDWDPTAAAERPVAPFSAAAVVGTLAKTVFGTGEALITQFGDEVEKFLTPSPQEEADVIVRITNDANTLSDPGSALASQTLPIVYGREGPGNSGRPVGTVYTLTLNAEGKYVVSATQTLQTAPGGKGQPTGEEVTLPSVTFNTTNEAAVYLVDQGVRPTPETPPS